MRNLLAAFLVAACHRSPAQAPDAGGRPLPDVVLLPSAADAADGVWARGCARMMAHQIDHAAGRDAALVAVVVAATPRRVGWVLPSAPVALDQAATVARRNGSRWFARIHIYGPDERVRNILMDVFEVEGLKTVHSRAYPYNPHSDLPPLKSATLDLAGTIGIKDPSGRVLEGAQFIETQNLQALEAFLGGLDNLALAAAARGRPLGAGFRAPKELFDEAVTADPAFQSARNMAAAGAAARFDRLLVSEIALKE